MNYTSPESPVSSKTVLESIQENRKTLPLDEAAIHMGLKPDTLRKRLQAGTEDGFKGADKRWNVYVSGVQDTPEDIAENNNQAMFTLLREVQQRLIDMKESQNFLKAHIAEKDKALAAKDEMIRELISKLSSTADSLNPNEKTCQAINDMEDEVGNVASIADVLAMMSTSELQSTGKGLGWVAGKLYNLSGKLEEKHTLASKAAKVAKELQSD